MSVVGAYGVTLEVPDIAVGLDFYRAAGLEAQVDGDVARLHCVGEPNACIVLIGGAPRKRLHHIALQATPDAGLADRIARHGGRVVKPPVGSDPAGLWLADPHGMIIHLIAPSAPTAFAPGEPFAINEPGRLARKNRPAILPGSSYAPVRPLRLGHILLFSPDVMRSVDFFVAALGMRLADHAQDVIAFLCAARNSDHHVVAFAKSGGTGFHHASFQVGDPDMVGRGGRALAKRAGRGDWGFGRHTIGSNFFHYIQDPWGSWFEYYSDMDHIGDHDLWTPTNYAMEDSLASWAPPVPEDFVHNYELGDTPA